MPVPRHVNAPYVLKQSWLAAQGLEVVHSFTSAMYMYNVHVHVTKSDGRLFKSEAILTETRVTVSSKLEATVARAAVASLRIGAGVLATAILVCALVTVCSKNHTYCRFRL